MKRLYDVVVVGAGPIGSYTAYQLVDKGFDVCVLDEKERIGKEVICAGVVSKEAFKRYDLPSESILSRIDSFTFVSPSTQRLEYKHPDVFAYVVSREKFDDRLLKLAKRCGADVRLRQRVTEIKESSNGLKKGGKMIYLLLLFAVTHFEFREFNLNKNFASHAILGGGSGAIINEYFRDQYDTKARFMASVFYGGITTGYLIEVYDANNGGYPDGYDWLATITGSVFGFFFDEWIYNRGRKDEIRRRAYQDEVIWKEIEEIKIGK